MTWFVAHWLEALKPVDYVEGPFFLYENMMLVEGGWGDDVEAKATSLAEASIINDDGLEIDGRPGVRSFLGIRKINAVSNPLDYDDDQWEKPPVTGTEVSYSEFWVSGEEAARKLVSGEPVDIEYLD